MSAQRKYPPKETIQRIRLWCDRQERAQQEVRDKLYSWGLHQQEVEEVIAGLIIDNYLNEERFARAYASGRFRIKRWGRKKIIDGLRHRKISTYCIQAAMTEIDEEEYRQTAVELVVKKNALLKTGANRMERFQKLTNYMLQKGYERDLVVRTVNFVLNQAENADKITGNSL